eukprot:GHVR01036351.1.p1 GENE.GHVR01036351.1~~GHVR01036351.1.p1  ORF type:complete len:193 (+),score=40.82 GHVR01036351.1:1110-1688(+)
MIFLISENGNFKLYVTSERIYINDVDGIETWGVGKRDQDFLGGFDNIIIQNGRIQFQVREGGLAGRSITDFYTETTTGVKAVLENDGRFVLYDASDIKLWDTTEEVIFVPTMEEVTIINRAERLKELEDLRVAALLADEAHRASIAAIGQTRREATLVDLKSKQELVGDPGSIPVQSYLFVLAALGGFLIFY